MFLLWFLTKSTLLVFVFHSTRILSDRVASYYSLQAATENEFFWGEKTLKITKIVTPGNRSRFFSTQSAEDREYWFPGITNPNI